MRTSTSAKSDDAYNEFVRVALIVFTVLFVVAGACLVAEEYPRDITPPPGTRYPCALTALPKDLPGIPTADRIYINSTYARILRATQAKLVALKALDERKDIDAAVSRYDAAVAKILETLRADRPVAGLELFHADVIAAMELQRVFFRRAAVIRRGSGTMGDVYAVAEGRQASARLIGAWGRMSARYPRWSADTRDSIYHHLCALDLF